MIISGSEIREAAEEHEKTCPKMMKDSFYYGFREGAKWAQHTIYEAFKAIDNLTDEEE